MFYEIWSHSDRDWRNYPKIPILLCHYLKIQFKTNKSLPQCKITMDINFQLSGTYDQWRSQGGATGANAPVLMTLPRPRVLNCFLPRVLSCFWPRGLPRVLNCFSPRVDIGLNCHPNLFVEFTNLLIVFSNSY